MSVISLAGHEVRSQEEGWASLSPPCSVLPKDGKVGTGNMPRHLYETDFARLFTY